jgi:glycosyltransferase involved in cell wall biosynthesis
MKPLVSICIPAYNAERFIEETLDSALAQKYPNTEIIVSDDMSKDGTVTTVKKYQKWGVILVENEKNLGRSGNCNRVIKSSAGKYILKLDADDLVHPDHITEQVSVMEADLEITFAHCACRLIDINGKQIGYERSIHGSFIRSGIEEWPRYVFGPRAVNIVTIRRSAYDLTGGYDERYSYSYDWSMHRALLKLGKVFYNDHVLASYRVHSFGKSGVRLLNAKEGLLHIADIEQDWPDDVSGKAQLMYKCRKRLGIKTALDAAYCQAAERKEMLELVPLFGGDITSKAIARMVQLGLSSLILAEVQAQLRLRQFVKNKLYSHKA